MERTIKRRGILSRVFASLLCAMLAVLCAAPQGTFAEEAQVVRVGRFPYEEQMRRDSSGGYTGYGYDYLREIARYTGWRYEYVDAPWSECLAMLARGEIDLMGAAMRSAEREEVLDFSRDPMISGYGVLATPLSDKAPMFEEFGAFNGLKVGVMKDNLHRENFLAYSREHGFNPVIAEYETQGAMEEALEAGEIDALILTNTLRSQTLQVVAIFGENDGYFATTKGNSAILGPLDDAMRQIRLRDPYFNGKMNQKYYNLQTSTTIAFSRAELDFIQNSPPILCAFIPAPPISYYDEATGTIRGVAVDVCHLLEEETGLTFEWINTHSAGEATDMIRRGEALLLHAKYDDNAWADQNAMVLTEHYLEGQMVMVSGGPAKGTEVVALYDRDSQSRLVADAIAEGSLVKMYDTIVDCIEAVLGGEAGKTFASSTVASYLLNNPKYAGLQTTPLYGYTADVAIAVSRHADPLLLSVLNKGLGNISPTTVNQIVLSQMTAGRAGPTATYLYLHPAETVLVILLISLALILALLVLLHIRKQNDQQMRKTLYNDALTGRPNYRALSMETPRLIERHPGGYALLYMDIRRFKVINDTFGYEAGNRVLIAVSQAVDDFLDSEERAARIYADTFVLLLRFSAQQALRERLDRLFAKLEQLSFQDSDAIKPLFRGGVYLMPGGVDSLDRACDRANYAKSSISRQYTNAFLFYDDVIHSRVLAEKDLESSMATALERREFIPYYQPKVNTVTNKVAGAEALVRWRHPEKGILPPGGFLPFYEENGFIVKIDLAVFEQVCQDLKRWIQARGTVVPISVNFSRRHIEDQELPGKLKAIADRYQVPTNLLEIEITETEELGNVENAVRFVSALADYGFGISIDDFGTGYSSISFLQQLPLDTLKLDRKFILNAMKTDKAKDVMRYLVEAMQKNNVRILCEGVETQEQRDFVIGLNCRFIQGYLYSVPLPKEDFESYLLQQGMDGTEHLDFIPITRFDQNRWSGAEDFLTRAMPSWILSNFVAPDYPIHYISPSFLEGLGYSALELITLTGGRYVELVHPDDLPGVLERLETNKDSTQDLLLQYRLRKKDGSYLWIREINKRILTEDGREALLGICTNITDMALLQEEKSRIIETIPGGVGELRLTREGPIIQSANERFYEVIGYAPEEMEAMDNNLFHIINRPDLPDAARTLREMLDTDKPSCECTFQMRHRDQSLHWVTFRGTISRALQGPQVTVIIFDSDGEIQARQTAEMDRAKLELALASAGQAVFEYDVATQNMYSYSGLSTYGIPGGEQINVRRDLLRSGFVHPDDAPKIQEVGREIAAGAARTSYEARVRKKYLDTDSAFIWVRVTLSTIFDESGKPVRAVGIVENIHQQKRFEHAFEQEAQYRKAFTESSLMAYEFNLTKDTVQRIMGTRGFRLRELSQRLEHPDRYSEMLRASAQVLVVADDRERFAREMSLESLMRLYKNGIYETELEYRRLTPDGQEFWNAVQVCLLLDRLSADVIGYAYHRDIHQRKTAERGLAEQVVRDPLTGILNRLAAEQQIREFLDHQADPKRVQAFLMMDLDRFKAMNDTYGHLTGDRCLVKLAQTIAGCVREKDIVARMGGDEFSILLKDLPDEGRARVIAEKLARAAGAVGEELGIERETRVSVGVALYPLHGTDFETLYRHADKAMYDAKRNLDARVVVFEGD